MKTTDLCEPPAYVESPCPLHEGYHCQDCCPECRFIPLVEVIIHEWIPGDDDKTIQVLEAFNGKADVVCLLNKG